MGLISIENVGKTYGQTDSDSAVHVLSGINAEIREGEFIALMGPSGSGKSTLLTIIGAMNHPSTGKVLIDGIDVYGLSDERRADFRMGKLVVDLGYDLVDRTAFAERADLDHIQLTFLANKFLNVWQISEYHPVFRSPRGPDNARHIVRTASDL